MRESHRLSPVLRVVRIVGLLLPLAAIVLVAAVVAPLLSSLPLGSLRVLMIALDLLLLSMACSLVVRISRTRFEVPDEEPFPLGSWRRPVRVLVLLATLPLGALAVAVSIPPTARAFELVFPISLLAAGVLLVANLVTMGSADNDGPMPTPWAR